MAIERQINWSLDCLLSKWSISRSALPNDSHTSPRPPPTRGDGELHCRLKSEPLLLRGLDIYKNIPFSVSKMTLDIQLGFISFHLTVVKLWPVNPRVISDPPKMSLLLEAKSVPTFIIIPRLILVAKMDDISWYITSNQHGRMFVQNLKRIVSKPNVMPGHITANRRGALGLSYTHSKGWEQLNSKLNAGSSTMPTRSRE